MRIFVGGEAEGECARNLSEAMRRDNRRCRRPRESIGVPKKQSSSLRKQGPIATGGYNCKGSCHNRCLKSHRHGVWVPALSRGRHLECDYPLAAATFEKRLRMRSKSESQTSR